MQKKLRLSAAISVLILLSAVLLYVAFCAEQNATGRAAWHAAISRVRSAGEPTSYQALIPPPVPASRNLGAIDLFKVDYDPEAKYWRALRLEAAVHNLFGSSNPPQLGSFLQGKRTDRTKLFDFLASQHQRVFPNQPLPASPLAQFDDLCPALATLRNAAATHDECRFERDYQTDPPWNRGLGNITRLIKLAQAANLHAVTALECGQPDLALQDIRVILKLDAAARREPIIISGLVAIGVFALIEQSVWDGLETHTWNDAQLAELQSQLASIDFLQDGQLCLRGEALGYLVPNLDYLKTHQYSCASLITGVIDTEDDDQEQVRLLWYLSPKGWFDLAKARGLAADFGAARVLDPQARRVYPNKLTPDGFSGVSDYEPPMTLALISVGPVLPGVAKFALGQFRVDAARIACLLERYRLAHGALPTSLDQLATLGSVPLDLCDGQPYRYTPKPDGTFLLYSVGWNLSDDGGTVVRRAGEPKVADEKKGDWVWPQPGRPGT